MTEEQFDALVRLIQVLAYREAGNAVHQRRAGAADDDIEEARHILVDEVILHPRRRRDSRVDLCISNPVI